MINESNASKVFEKKWSEVLNDYYLYCPDEHQAQSFRKLGYPVYGDSGVIYMMVASDGGYDTKKLQEIHGKFKKLANKYKK